MTASRFLLKGLVLGSIFALSGFCIGALSVLPTMTSLSEIYWLPWSMLLFGMIGAITGFSGGLVITVSAMVFKSNRLFALVALVIGGLVIGFFSNYFLQQIHSIFIVAQTTAFVGCFAVGFLLFHNRIRAYLQTP